MPPELATILGVVTMAMGKFGEIAERFVVAHERMAGAFERLEKEWTPRADALSELALAHRELAEQVRGIQKGYNDFRDYDKTRDK